MEREGQLEPPGRRRRRVPLRRFLVAESSMEPTLVAGQGVLATTWWPVRAGQIRVFEHPDRPRFWLVKRVAAVDAGSMIVESDNTAADGAVDSSTFGPVPTAGSYRVMVAVPRRWM